MAKSISLRITLLLFTLMFAASCKKGPLCNCIDSTGAPSEETVEVPFFDQVDANDNISVVLGMGPTEQVEIAGGKNLIAHVSATVSGGILTLKNDNKCNWLRSYQKNHITVYVTMPYVIGIINQGVGTIESKDTITTKAFYVVTLGSAGDIILNVRSQKITGHLFGAANVTLSGTCDSLLCYFYGGTGYTYCNNLNTLYTYISSSTTGDCYVNSSSQLVAIDNSSGNIYYTGNPLTISQTTKGSGHIIEE